MKRLLIVLFCVAVVFCMYGCGGSSSTSAPEEKAEEEEPAAEEPKAVELVESGYAVDDSDDVYFGAVIKNPDDKTAYEYASVVATAYNDKGEEIGKTEDSIKVILPGEQVAAATFALCDEKPDKVEITVETGYPIEPSDDMLKASDFEIKDLEEKTSEDVGLMAIKGKIKNNSSVDRDMVDIIFLFRKDGKIVYGDSTYVENLGAGEEGEFAILKSSDLPEYDNYEVSVSK